MRFKVLAALLISTLAVRADEQLPLLKVGSETFTNVVVTKVTAADIYFISNSGMGNAKLKNLDPVLQKHFHFDPDKAGDLEKAHAQANTQYQGYLSAQPVVHPPDMSRPIERNVPVGLAIGQRFPDFTESDLNGAPLSIAGAKGKVLLVDFWATWCGPCRGEMPNVIAAYQKYHSLGFDIIGVSLDEDLGALVSYTTAQGMPWPQYFDGKGWDNKLAGQYGVHSIPTSYLLDRNGIILGKGLRGRALDRAIYKALTDK
jgi:thiol-disulfide isomerase/thioredoxin